MMKTYKVGGFVRDHLLGVQSHDVDYVVVGSSPQEMLSAGFKQVGADFPVFLDENGTEYALARTERKTGTGYNGFVTDHSSEVTLEDDLLRRDLTINAMAMDSNGTVVDPFGGQKDLDEKVLRHVSEAFAEDPVQVLRLARFHARYGHLWTVAPETLDLCREMVAAGELDHLTRERVLKELFKALDEKSSLLFFTTLHEVGALKVVFPEVKYLHQLLDSDASARVKYALEFTEATDKRLNVDTDTLRFARMVRVLVQDLGWVHDVDRLYAMDAYRNRDVFWQVMEEMPSDYSFTVERLTRAMLQTQEVSFADLTEGQQLTLKGPAVGEAIKELRKAAVN